MTKKKGRCPTGINGLDDLLCGGFPRGRTLLLSGSCGTGKSTFGVQYLINGIVKYNEPGVLVTLEEDPKELRSDMLGFGFDLQAEEDKGNLVIIDTSLSRMGFDPDESSGAPFEINPPKGSMSLLPDEFSLENIIEIIIKKTREIGAKRVIIDSLPALDFLLGSTVNIKHTIRQLILSMNYRLKAAGLTSILITEPSENEGFSKGISTHGVESYVADGVIIIHYSTLGTDAGRFLIIRKMRGTKHSEDVHPIVFTEGVGIKVLGAEDAYNI